jgi:membrane-associated phospholipid phosphatase
VSQRGGTSRSGVGAGRRARRYAKAKAYSNSRFVIWVFLVLWIAAIAAAFALDKPVASRVYTSGLYNTVRWSRIAQAIKFAGEFYVSIAIGALLCFWRGQGIRAAVLLWLSGTIAGLYYVIGKWIFGRSRPIFDNGVFNTHPFAFDYFHGGWRGLILTHPNLSFPSGHACLAFASATALGMLIPRWQSAFLVFAMIIGAERILEGSHYVSDAIAGAGMGVLAAIAAAMILRRLNFLPAKLSETTPPA